MREVAQGLRWGVRQVLPQDLGPEGHYEAAAGHLREAVTRAPDDAELRIDLGAVLSESGDPGRRRLEPMRYGMLRPDPRVPNAHMNLGVHSRTNGDPDGARRHLDNAIRLEPRNAAAHWNLGDLLRQLGQYRKALVSAESGPQLAARKEDWSFDLTKHLPTIRSHAEDEEQLDRFSAGAFVPEGPDDWVSLVRVLHGQARYRVAAQASFEALARVDNTSSAGITLKARGQISSFAAGLGVGLDAPSSLPSERAELRGIAESWLLKLSALTKVSEPGVSRIRIRKSIHAAAGDVRLAPIRDPTFTTARSAEKRARYEAFRTKLRTLLADRE